MPEPTPEPGPVTAIEVTAAGLTLVDTEGLVVEGIPVADGSDAVLAITTWADAGASVRVSPPDDGSPDPFLSSSTSPRPFSDIVATIPEGPAVGEDGGPFFDSVPTAQQGDGFGTMIYEPAPGIAADADFHDLRGAGGYVDENRILEALMTQASHSAFSC